MITSSESAVGVALTSGLGCSALTFPTLNVSLPLGDQDPVLKFEGGLQIFLESLVHVRCSIMVIHTFRTADLAFGLQRPKDLQC